MSSRLLLSIFIHGFSSTLFSFRTNIVFILEQTVFMFSKHFKLIESNPNLNLVYSYRTLALYTILYSVTLLLPLTSSRLLNTPSWTLSTIVIQRRTFQEPRIKISTIFSLCNIVVMPLHKGSLQRIKM